MEALNDPTSGLTYPALTGSRKQSVVDAERKFNLNLSMFMEKRKDMYKKPTTSEQYGIGRGPLMNVASVNDNVESLITSC